MPTVRGSVLLREIATIHCADEASWQRWRYRRDAIDLVERDNLLDAAYRMIGIVPLDEAGEQRAAGRAAKPWMPCGWCLKAGN